jgi:hypothetical protein
MSATRDAVPPDPPGVRVLAVVAGTGVLATRGGGRPL